MVGWLTGPLSSGQAYAVTKAAQIHLVKALAIAAAPKIRVNSVSPSLMLTVRAFVLCALVVHAHACG